MGSLRYFFLFLLSLVCKCLLAQTNAPFEAEIRAFERLDSIEKPAKGQILLYGSSTMRLWTTFREDLEGYKVVNRGFGGSQMSDAVYYFDRVVLPLAPSWILLYEGDNDISNGNKSPEKVFGDFENLMQLVEQKLPGTKVAIFTLRPSIAREHLMPKQRQLNALFKKYCKKHKKKACFIDVYDLLLTPAGKPNPEYLDADMLHLNAKGYEVWAKATRDFLKNRDFDMPRIAFKMKLHPGREAEYQRRHDALWPELEALLKQTGISEYSIFLDEKTLDLFGVLNIDDPARLDDLPGHPVMQRWWAHVADIMDTNPDNSPVSSSLVQVFHMP